MTLLRPRQLKQVPRDAGRKLSGDLVEPNIEKPRPGSASKPLGWLGEMFAAYVIKPRDLWNDLNTI